MSKNVSIGSTVNLIFMACLFLPLSANSTSILINSSVSGYAFDGGHSGGGQMDGAFDGFGTAEDIFIRKITGTGSQSFNFAEFRGAFEFQLPANGVVSKDSVESASLEFTTSYASFTQGDFIKIYGYSADGQLQLTDYSQTDFLVGTAPLTGSSGDNLRNYSVDITDYFTSDFDNAEYVGFLFEVSWWNVFATLNPTADLEITYAETSQVPLPGALFLFSSGCLILMNMSLRKRS